jgi:menaquinone-9 beta-reductase
MIPAFDVIVVGGGPAGSSCAMMLARHGIRVLLLEKSRFPRDKICGDCVNPGIWELLETLGVGEEIRREMGPRISSVAIRNDRGQRLEVLLAGDTRGPFFAMSRKVLDEILLRRAMGDGVAVHQGLRITDIRRAHRWNVCVRSDGGDQTNYAGSELVGADGRNSLVARWVSQRARARRNPAVVPGRVGVQWETHRQASIGSSLEMTMFDCGYGGVVNLGSETANIAMVVEPDIAKLAFTDFHGFLLRTLWKQGDNRDRFANVKPLGVIRASSPIDQRPMPRGTSHARCIGDAKHVVEPFAGQGVLFAVHDGISAAWDILTQLSVAPSFARPAPLSRFLAARLFLFLLHDMKLANRLARMAFGYPPAIQWITRRVL